jgi:hypothetical protein
MTKKSEATRRKLQQDIEAYLCGEVPSPLEMMRAATLEHWETTVRRRGKEFVLVMRGDIHKHPQIPDGEDVQTSPVAWFDRKWRFVRTINRLYCLGQPAGREIPADGVDL